MERGRGDSKAGGLACGWDGGGSGQAELLCPSDLNLLPSQGRFPSPLDQVCTHLGSLHEECVLMCGGAVAHAPVRVVQGGVFDLRLGKELQ